MSLDRTPPSTYRLPSIVTGGQMPGTAQLAATAATSGTPDRASKIRNSPVAASTATSRMSRAGHSCDRSRDSITARRAASGTVCASSA